MIAGPTPRKVRRRTRGRALALVVVAGVTGSPGQAQADPEGEQRSVVREADRPYQVVAGEADASAVVQNPANLGYLKGFNGVADFSFTTQGADLRGSGVGVFAAVPLPFQILSLGVGVQQFWRGLRTDETLGDAPYGKFTFAAGVPLGRWARGLSLGVEAGALYSRQNDLIDDGQATVGLGLSWRANRFVSLGVTVDNLNGMRLAESAGNHRTSLLINPELALRPMGTRWLEFAVGMRIEPFGVEGDEAGVSGDFVLQPRGRILAGYNGVRVFAEAERVAFERAADLPGELVEDALRMSFGLQFDTPHFGMSAGTIAAVGTSPTDGIVGGNGRLRFSGERYADSVELRPRKVTRLDLAKYKGERGSARLVYQIDELTRLGAGALLLDARNGANSYAQIEEIREALLRFRSGGGKVACFVDGPATRTYFLASVADRIYAQPGGELNIVGVSLRGLYWGELLSRLGIESDFVRIAEYKGSAEVYGRDTASDPVAAQRDLLLMDSWNHIVRSIANERGFQARQLVDWINRAPITPEYALEVGLVDQLIYADQLDEALEDWLRRRVRIQSPSPAPRRPSEWGKQAHVAVLYVEGDLVDGKSAVLPLVGNKLAGAETLTKEIRRLRKDPHVRAIVMRVASRGGSVTAAKAIAHELDLTREKKPVIVSFGSVAASGGYWIATGGDFIFADALTMTGSIGIFYPKMDLSGFLERFGVGVDLVGYGSRAHMRSWFKAYTPAEREAAQTSIQYSYDEFTARVGRARSMSPEQVDAVARGRVWSGVRAIDVGLVDTYGGLREAIIRARQVAELPVNAPAYTYPARPTLRQQLETLFGLRIPRLAQASADPDGVSIGVPAAPRRGRFLGAGGASSRELAVLPLVRVLALIPPSLWLLDAPEAMALTEWDATLE